MLKLVAVSALSFAAYQLLGLEATGKSALASLLSLLKLKAVSALFSWLFFSILLLGLEATRKSARCLTAVHAEA